MSILLLLALVTPAGGSVSQAEPPGRGAAVVVYAPARDALVVYGGVGAEPRAWSDLWEWRDGEWHERWSDADSGPGDRFNHAGAWHSATGMLVVHGGGGIDERLGDTWGWKEEGWTHLTAGLVHRRQPVPLRHPSASRAPACFHPSARSASLGISPPAIDCMFS
jgi:hypothetical protein